MSSPSSSSSSSSNTVGQWSPWYNSDRPWIGTGDVETLKSIEHHFGPVCGFREHIEATQCQLTKYGQEFTDITAHTLKDELKIPCTSKGLLCLNNQQDSGFCHDYAVRFLCTLSNDSDVTNQDTDYFPQFDARIYIILAVVPILVFILRVLWGFVFRRRRRQRRRRARRHGEDDEDDSSSIASSLAHAPPSYHQLFGDLGTNRSTGNGSIFAITRNTVTVCQGCKETKCSVATALCHAASSSAQENSNGNSSVVVIPVSENTRQSILQHNVLIEGNRATDISPRQEDTELGDLTTRPQPSTSVASEHSNTTQNHSSTTDNVQTQNYSVSMRIEREIPVRSASEEGNNSSEFASHQSQPHPQPSSLSSTSAAALSSSTHTNSNSNTPRGEEILLKAPSTPRVSNGISQPCPCACHRTVAIPDRRGRSVSSAGFDNAGFQGDGSGADPAHPEVPALQRVYSNLSNGSVITLSELPSYEDALDLIKKKEQKATE